MKKQLKLAAVHEAGHAIQAVLHNSRLSSIEINEKGEGQAVWNHPLMKVLHTISHDDPVLKSFVTCLLSGISAELYFEGKLSSGQVPSHCEDDIETAWHYMKSRGWKPPTANYSCNDYFRDFGGQAKVFALCYQREVENLAKKLVEKREMSGQECVLFLEKIWSKPWPTKARRYYEHKK